MTRRALPAFLLLAACSRTPEPLPSFQTIPAFTLTAQDGRTFASERELRGKVWVAGFIYTTCKGPCPRMSRLMKTAAGATSGLANVRYVSFTVDPEHDTPAHLDAYARRYAADTRRWSFLTGTREQLHALMRDAFTLGDVDGSLNHSTRLVLVDARGTVRGFYGTADDADVPKLIAGIKQLAGESAP
ncbi:MAG: SCO family protein [Bryobacterales bacterium]|nr:SCO family protein [Bryobacterales bacterium]